MEAFRVRPSGALSGAVRVSGAKNSALKLLAASLLAEGSSVLRNVPAIADVRVMADVLRHLGATVTAEGPDAYALDIPAEIGTSTPAELVRQLRASIVVLGPLLARCGQAHLAMPGGCNLGSRNIDLHLAGLAQLGAELTYGQQSVTARTPGGRLHGADVELPFASVGATENLLMAAVRATGVTRIKNAAREPEIIDLAAYLNAMGAAIHGAGTREITIEGVDRLQAVDHSVVGDRIEAGTFAVAAALCGGVVRIEGSDPADLRLPIDRLQRAGVGVEPLPQGLEVTREGPLAATDVITLPYPGFPTDLQPQFCVLLSQAHGTSMLTENVFESRFRFIDELARMGADITIEGHHAIVRGPSALQGAQVQATDLRAGAALVLAGLVAEGDTVVLGAGHVDRGYADFAGKLARLGADVERVGVDTPASVA